MSRQLVPLRAALLWAIGALILIGLAAGSAVLLNAVAQAGKPTVTPEDVIVTAVANEFVNECSGDLALVPHFERWDGRDAIIALTPEADPARPVVTLRVRDDGSIYHVTTEGLSNPLAVTNCPPFDVVKP